MTTWSHPRIEIAYNRASNNLLKWGPFTLAGVEITTGATAKLWLSNPSGTALLSDQTMTADGSYFTKNIDTSTVASYPLDQGYPATVKVTYSTTVYEFHALVDVVRTPLVCMVCDADLKRYVPQLDARRPSTQTSYAPQILTAFEEVQNAILSKGYRTALLFDPASFRPAILFRTLAICSKSVWKKAAEDRWEEDYQEYMALYRENLDRALDGVSTRVDENEDGLLQAGEEESYQPHRFLL